MECKECYQSEIVKSLTEKVTKLEEEQSEMKDSIIELRISKGKMEEQISNLLKKMDEFISTIKWALGGFIAVSTLAVSVIALILK